MDDSRNPRSTRSEPAPRESQGNLLRRSVGGRASRRRSTRSVRKGAARGCSGRRRQRLFRGNLCIGGAGAGATAFALATPEFMNINYQPKGGCRVGRTVRRVAVFGRSDLEPQKRRLPRSVIRQTTINDISCRICMLRPRQREPTVPNFRVSPAKRTAPRHRVRTCPNTRRPEKERTQRLDITR